MLMNRGGQVALAKLDSCQPCWLAASSAGREPHGHVGVAEQHDARRRPDVPEHALAH